MSRGAAETTRLKLKLEEQMDRLMDQLSDLEEVKNDLSPTEYAETKEDTLEQMREFSETLDKMIKGDMTLVDELNGLQLAIQAAISESFRTPEIIRLFAKKQPDHLRQKLTQLERDSKIGSIDKEQYSKQKSEILQALRKLGVKLSDDEAIYLENNATTMENFVKVAQNVTIDGSKLLKLAEQSGS